MYVYAANKCPLSVHDMFEPESDYANLHISIFESRNDKWGENLPRDGDFRNLSRTAFTFDSVVASFTNTSWKHVFITCWA